MALADVQGRKVYYEIHGDAPGPPLVLVMGMAGSCKGWLPLQVPAFSAERRTVLLENRGVGESTDPGGPFSTGDLADDVAGLLDALDVERADVLGAFMGGMAAQELALRHPDRVERLVLTGTYARPDAKRRILLEKWREMALARTSARIWGLERLLWTLQDETLEQSDLVEAFERSFPGEALPIPSDLFVRQCEACLAHDTAERLRAVRQPALVLCGRHDQLTPPRLHRELADALPNGRLVTLGDGAHLVLAETAERFNQTVLHFLAEDR